MNDIIKDNWNIIEEKVIKPMYEDGSFPLTVADEITKALQKQIPKKPKIMETPLVGEKFWWYCGHCGASRHTGSKSNYCGYCGGKVDWRNKDE
jgi:hypothetical protein